MATSVEYVNRALHLLGAQPITALSLEDSPNAATAVALYQPAVDELLAEWPWRFATTRVQLSEVAEDLPGPTGWWTHQYAIPNDCLKIIRTDRQSGRWEIFAAPGGVEGGGMQRRLYSDETLVWADMVRRIDPTLFPAHFQRALVNRLAAVLAMPVTRKWDIAQYFAQMADRVLAGSKAHDANEQPMGELDDGNLLADARYGWV